MNKSELARLKKIAKSSAAKIDQSAFFLSLFTEGYAKDPIALMQLALGISAGKAAAARRAARRSHSAAPGADRGRSRALRS